MAQELSYLEAIYEYNPDAHILNVITSFPNFYSSFSPTKVTHPSSGSIESTSGAARRLSKNLDLCSCNH